MVMASLDTISRSEEMDERIKGRLGVESYMSRLYSSRYPVKCEDDANSM